jgi:HAD superfamily hydrolase (TIGR01459 family)
MPNPVVISGVSKIADQFDLFILDQFGVLHDGSAPYPGVLDCISELRRSEKKIIILSNSGKRSRENEKRLENLGFPAGSWDVFLSSGEAAWRSLASGIAYRSCFLISRDDDRSAIDGLTLEPAGSPGEADVILLTASEGDRFDLLHYERLLSGAARRGVPCLCTNPDKVMLTPSGQKFGAGRIAELYAKMGGPVRFVGKPYPAIYEAALSAMGNPDKSRVICIGDSVEHDISGAASAGLCSALVRTGIHAEASETVLNEEYNHHNARPDFILPGLVW